MSGIDATFWRRCNICKKEISFFAKYYLCSVSTCRGKRTGLIFCSVECWDAHLGFANHRTSFAEEAKSPTKEAHMSQHEESQEQMQMNPTNTATAIENAASDHSGNSVAEQAAGLVAGAETMIVVSKVKKFIRDQGGLNTSEDAITALTQKVIEECLKGIERAKSDGRKTFMGRDVL